MSKFNIAREGTKTINLAGGEAHKQTPKLELLSILLTSFVQDQYYRSDNDALSRVRELVTSESDKKFIAKAAIYARNEFGMRSISHAVAGELAHTVKGQDWTKNFYEKVVRRPDDITEILSYYIANYKKPIPNSLKKGLAAAFGKFDAYQLAKYRGEGKGFSLVDVVNMVRPVPNQKNGEALKQLVEGTLRSTDTWEAKLSEAGKEDDVDAAKEGAWRELIVTRKIGYFALLRNLRNIVQQAPEIVPQALEMLVDRELIKKSLVLPFRFTTALKELEGIQSEHSRAIVTALNQAVELSLDNVPKLPGRTLIALDGSGSMSGKPIEIASLFAAVLYKALDSQLVVFDTSAQHITVDPNTPTMALRQAFLHCVQGGGTDFNLIFSTTTQKYDRIIILSDMQAWVGYDTPRAAFNNYKVRTGADPKIYSFDLQGYGSMQLPERNVYALAGFSDKIFDVMGMLETDKQALINKIEAVEL